jgi:dephospho-CoA kinase
MVVIGLTGGIASGKSTVSGMLSELGAVILNADEVGHELFQPHTEVWQEVVTAFSKGILKENDDIDRSKLGEIVFHDPKSLDKLDKITHPRMFHIVRDKLDKLRQQGVEVAILEAPLLIEANWLELVDQIWVTVAPEETIIQRLCSRTGLTEEQARSRIRSQMPMEKKTRYADIVIDTDCAIAQVKEQVVKLWEELHYHKPKLEEEIRKVLHQRKRKTIPAQGLSRAAVLIPIYQEAGEYHILFTKRTEKVAYHKGQISFPGGAQDEGDENLAATALRESFEEIGLHAQDAKILGELDDARTFTSKFVITPFVAVIPYPYEFKMSPKEVEELIEVPLSALLNPNNFSEQLASLEGELVTYCQYKYRDHIIWGATAQILRQFLDLISSSL